MVSQACFLPSVQPEADTLCPVCRDTIETEWIQTHLVTWVRGGDERRVGHYSHLSCFLRCLRANLLSPCCNQQLPPESRTRFALLLPRIPVAGEEADERSQAIWESVVGNDIDQTRDLLIHEEISQADRDLAILLAVVLNHKEIFNVLSQDGLLQNRNLSVECWFFVIKAAVIRNRSEYVLQLFEGVHNIVEKINIMTQLAVEHNHLGMLVPLLNSGPISEEASSLIILFAVRHNHRELLEFILPGISENNMSLAITSAARHNCRELLALLLSREPIPDDVWIAAVREAVNYKSAEALECVLSKVVLSQAEYERAVQSVIEKNDIRSLQHLLKYRPLSEAVHGWAIRTVMGKPDAGLLRLLLASRSLSEINLGLAVKEAAWLGDAASLKLLLASGRISSKARQKALRLVRLNPQHSAELVQALSCGVFYTRTWLTAGCIGVASIVTAIWFASGSLSS